MGRPYFRWLLAVEKYCLSCSEQTIFVQLRYIHKGSNCMEDFTLLNNALIMLYKGI
jgi:hypothetical protein